MCDITRAPAQLSLPGEASGSLGPFIQEQARTLPFSVLGKRKDGQSVSTVSAVYHCTFTRHFFFKLSLFSKNRQWQIKWYWAGYWLYYLRWSYRTYHVYNTLNIEHKKWKKFHLCPCTFTPLLTNVRPTMFLMWSFSLTLRFPFVAYLIHYPR